jgi:hypothetical protein
MCPLPGRGLFQLRVPLLKQEPQFPAQGNELLNRPIQFLEASSHKVTNGSARRTALVASAQDSFQIGKRESDDERSLNEQHSLHRRCRISPIPRR